MRTLIQRVSHASVTTDNKCVGKISKGILVLLGIHSNDTQKEIDWLSNKIVNLRIFDDEEGRMDKSLLDIQGELLIVSQFTLYGDVKKGKRPSYLQAAPPHIAIPLYESFLEACQQLIVPTIQSGTFGANMQVTLTNDGPVTIWIDTESLIR